MTRPKVQIVPAMAQFALGSLAALLSYSAPDTPSRTFILVCLALVAASLMAMLITKLSEPAPRNWATVEILFASTFSIVQFAYIVYWYSGFFPEGQEIWKFRKADCPNTVNMGIAMYVACLCAFLMGYYLLPLARLRPVINESPIPPALSEQWGRLGRTLIRLGFCAFAAFVLIAGPELVFAQYRGTNRFGFLPNIVFQLGQVFIPAGVAIVTSSRQKLFRFRDRGVRLWGLGPVDLTLISLTIVAIGIHGDRSTLMFIFLAVLVAHNEYIKPMKARTLAMYALASIFLLGFIVAVRSAVGGARDQNLNPVENINNALINFGSSSLCGFVALDYVPSEHRYYYGQMQSLNLAGIVPFGRKLLGMTDTVDNSSSHLMTKLIQGTVGGGVAGTGTSMFADFYLDFGFLITAGIFVCIGVLSKYIVNKARTSLSLRWQVALICYITFLSLVSRYTFLGGFIRFVLYGVLYATAIALFLGIRMVAKSPREMLVQQQIALRTQL